MVHRSRFMLRFIVTLTFFGSVPSAFAALIVNDPMPLTATVNVRPIIVSNSDGSNTAEIFGTASQQASIEGFVDRIWAQAGIDVNFLTPNTFNSTAANSGDRNVFGVSDLGAAAGVEDDDPNVINMYFVDRLFDSRFPGENSAAGVAETPGNAITQFVGSSLLDNSRGQEVIAGVVAHEIGHNLGLEHLGILQNLMQASPSRQERGQELNGDQIAIALGSRLSVDLPVTQAPPPPTPAPLPAAAWLFGSALLGLVGVRRRHFA